MQNKGALIVPSLFRISGYIVYFWSNENNEPIHVYIAEGVPSANATKVWLTQGGHCILANNNSKIPQEKINKILDVISAQFFFICAKWKSAFRRCSGAVCGHFCGQKRFPP